MSLSSRDYAIVKSAVNARERESAVWKSISFGMNDVTASWNGSVHKLLQDLERDNSEVNGMVGYILQVKSVKVNIFLYENNSPIEFPQGSTYTFVLVQATGSRLLEASTFWNPNFTGNFTAPHGFQQYQSYSDFKILDQVTVTLNVWTKNCEYVELKSNNVEHLRFDTSFDSDITDSCVYGALYLFVIHGEEEPLFAYTFVAEAFTTNK